MKQLLSIIALLGTVFGIIYISTQDTQAAPAFLEWMHAEGLTKYDNLTDFRGSDTITRGEAAKFVDQFAKLQIMDKTYTKCDFSDIDGYDSTLTPHIKQACLYGLMKGSNGKYRPNGKITEAEAITVVMRSIYGFFAETADPWYIAYYNRGSELGLIENETLRGVGTTNITREKLGKWFYQVAQLNEDGGFYSETAGQAQYTTYSKAKFDQALSDGKQMALFFHAIRCPICHGTRDVITDNINALPKDVMIFEVDYDKRQDLAVEYEVVGQTSFVFFDRDGNHTETSRSIYPEIIEELNKRFE